MSSSAGRNLRLSPEEYAKRLWDWTDLNECFERGIRLTDIDGFVEVGKKFLFLEGKPPGGRLPRGQKIALERLAQFPDITVVIIEGNPPFEIRGWRVIGKQRYKGNNEEFKMFIRMWFEWADKSDEFET